MEKGRVVYKTVLMEFHERGSRALNKLMWYNIDGHGYDKSFTEWNRFYGDETRLINYSNIWLS